MKRAIARKLAAEALTVSAKSVDKAREEYELYLRSDKGNKPRSIGRTLYAIRKFFPSGTELLTDLTPRRCRVLYEGRSDGGKIIEHGLRTRPLTSRKGVELKEKGKESPKVLAVDSHRNILAETKTFLDWCVSQRWISANPLKDVKGAGRRRKHGKTQLRIDEARKWLVTAVELAEKGDEGAVAAMMTMVMGVRSCEVVNRVVRDIDDGCRLLWIPDTKTEAGRRQIEIPDVIRAFIVRLVKGRGADRMLFVADAKANAGHWRDWPRKQVQRICKAARVPTVSAHGMRGLTASTALAAGVAAHHVAALLGHASIETTLGSYADPSAAHAGRQKRLLSVINGGAEPSAS